MNNGHFAGKLKKAVDEAVEKAKGKDGQFYKIMNAHGFYDVDDENNGLTDWQRAQVPDYNQHRISDMCNALAEIFGDMLGNDEYGVIYPKLDEIIGTLDINATKTASEMNVVGGALGGLTGGASESARQAMGQLTAILMGGFAFDPNILPPISFNFPGLPVDFASAFKFGSYPADWTFLYDFEETKCDHYYQADDGSIAIGAGIKLNMGPASARILKLVFSVPDTDKDGLPAGDAIGGISVSDYNRMVELSSKSFNDLTDEDKKFTLTSLQMRLAYFRYIQLTLWGAISNADNWAYLHWGCVAHNSCPSPVKTAVCSFIHTNGFAVDPNVCPEAGFISYCVNTGMAYKTGRSKTTALFLMPGMTYLDDKKNKQTATGYGWSQDNYGVPKDEHNANLHFALIADILSHLTYDSQPNKETLRKQRVAEANLIYEYLGMPTIKFGSVSIPPDLNANSMRDRGFGQLMKATIKVHQNKNSTIPLSDENFKIVLQKTAVGDLSETTVSTIKYILAKAGLPGVSISSIYRDGEAQARVMVDERQSNNGGIATSRKKAGREVNEIYTQRSKEVNGGKCIAIKDKAVLAKVQKEMENKINEYQSQGVAISNHGYDPDKIQAVDIAPNGTQWAFKYTDAQMRKLHVACLDAYNNKYLKQYMCPEKFGGPKVKDPAFHIEVWQGDEYPHPSGFGRGSVLPSIDCAITNANLKNKSTWDLVYVHDQTMA